MTRVPHRILVLASLLVVATAGVALALAVVNDELATDSVVTIGGMIEFTLVGAMIQARRSRNVVGTICLSAGLLLTVATVLRIVATAMDRPLGDAYPLSHILAVAASTSATFGIMLGSVVLITRFPSGRVGGWLGRTIDVAIVITVVGGLANVFRPAAIDYGWISRAPNPLGIPALGSTIANQVLNANLFAFGAVILGGGASLVIRYRRESSVARAQIRWFLTAITISLGCLGLMLASVLLGDSLPWTWDLWMLSFLLPPIVIGIAILRYRLYEIDRIISRTISWTVTTGAIVAVFAGIVVGLQGVLAQVTGGNTVAVAGSTLIVAALFQPLRRRVQRAVDRRFNRARYDSEQTLAAFGERVRAEIDLAALSDAVLATADEAVRPAAVGLWLRGAAE